MLGIYPIVPALGAVEGCTDHPCCCQSDTTKIHHGPAPVVYSAENGCCSSSANTPCDWNKNQIPDSEVCVISCFRQNRQTADGYTLSLVAETTVSKTTLETNPTNQFWRVANAIPIYLQNLTLIC